MKTLNYKIKTILVLAVILGFQANTILAASDGTDKAVLSTHRNLEDITFQLSPVLPVVADFSDIAPEVDFNVNSLAPATPSEADFEETSGTCLTSINDLIAPETPVTADFSDQV